MLSKNQKQKIFLEKLQKAIEESVVGIEIWFSASDWEFDKRKGMTFEDWILKQLDYYI